ncbi:MAG: GMC family oxidoreductase [Bacteroidota bacterium]
MTPIKSPEKVLKTTKISLSDKQTETLKAVCDTIIPSIIKNDSSAAFWELKASDLAISERVQEAIALQNREDQQEFRLLLNIFANPLVGFLTVGIWQPFYLLPFAKREIWLQKWVNSPIPPLRKGFKAIKKLTCFLFYSDTTRYDPNPVWQYLSYPGPLSTPPAKSKNIFPLHFSEKASISCDVVIIGSGAGGGVVARELAEAGKDIIVVEKGGYYNEADFNQKEADMISQLYEKSGALSNTQGSMAVFAGSCLGGGTVVNWAGTIRTPDYILEEWAKENQAPEFLSKAYQDSLDIAEKNIFTNTNTVAVNSQNNKLKTGSEKLGHEYKHIPQNIVARQGSDQHRIGYSCFGDQHSEKQSTLVNQLEIARDKGCRFLVSTEVEKVLIKNGKAIGIKAWQIQSDGSKTEVTVYAKKVVVAAGAIHSPAILMRSGLQHSQIGNNLYLHPVMGVNGLYKEPINSWWGGMMTITNNEFTNLDGPYGFKIETPPTHTGLIGLSLPWSSAVQHKQMMLQARNMANFIVLTRDKYTGGIKLDSQNNPVIDYKLHPYDLKHLLKGVKEGIKIHLAAGAEKAFILHNKLTELHSNNDAAIDKAINNLKWKENYFNLFSAHQMGTCRIGGNKKLHPVSPEGETYEVKGLYVMDASAFPKSSGANPMLSVEGLAHYLAQGIK